MTRAYLLLVLVALCRWAHAQQDREKLQTTATVLLNTASQMANAGDLAGANLIWNTIRALHKRQPLPDSCKVRFNRMEISFMPNADRWWIYGRSDKAVRGYTAPEYASDAVHLEGLTREQMIQLREEIDHKLDP